MAYSFKAATLSTNGLIPTLGITSEIEAGLMSVSSKTDWLSRLSNKQFNVGPTGPWKGEWLSVYQFLDYGYGTCYIGGTGSTGSYTTYSLTNTPLHNINLTPDLDVIFDCGNTFSAGAAISAANAREDCVAIIGNKSNLSNISGAYDSEKEDFGLTAEDSEFVAFIGGRKQIDTKVLSTWPSSYYTMNCSPDIAGLMAWNSNISDISTIVAGVGSTKSIKNVISLTQTLSDTDVGNLRTNNINPVVQYSGVGVFLQGNKTYYNNTASILNRLNVVVTLNYIKRNLKNILAEYLYTPNNSIIRSKVKQSLESFLKNVPIFSTISGGTYNVICDSTNNTTSTINQGKLVADVAITLPAYTEQIILNAINTENGETAFSVTIL